MIPLYNIYPPLLVSKKVALIGNSDSLLTNDYSTYIDTFPTIIRFNYSDILPKFTGKKTTIRWVNCPPDIHSANQHTKTITTDKDLITYTKKIFSSVNIIAWDSIKYKLSLYDKGFKFYTPNGLCTLTNINSFLDTLTPPIFTRFDTSNPNCWPRTGFQAILTCIKSGCLVHLFGFDIEEKPVIYHYSKIQPYITNYITQHQIANEIKILNELKDNNYIIVHT